MNAVPSPRLLQSQILEQERVHNEKYNMLLDEVNKLRNEKEEQKNLMPQSLVLSEDACAEASLKREITRLTSENLVGVPALSTCCLFLLEVYFILHKEAL